jgi:hypothetical protein
MLLQIIGQCDVNFMLQIKTITSVLKVVADIITSITGRPIRLSVIMSVTTFIASSITGRPIRLAVIMSVTTFIASSPFYIYITDL